MHAQGRATPPTRAYAKLDDKNRNLVRALCQKNGVTVGDDSRRAATLRARRYFLPSFSSSA